MPKLLQIDTCLGLGSTGKIAEIIGSLARDAGWETFMAHGSRFIGTSSMKPIQIGRKRDELWHYAISRSLDCHGLGSCNPTRDFIKKIEDITPDIVHVHNIHGYYVNYKLLFQYLAENGIPTVVTMHDFWLMTGHCAYINNSCDKWKTGCGHCHRLKEYPAAFIDRTKKNWALKRDLFKSFERDKIELVPVSYWLEEYARHSLLADMPIHTIQNGVNTRLFKPYDGEHSELWKSIDWRKYTIITVADRWTEANGFNDIMALSHLLTDEMQIVMVGLNSRQLQGLPANIVGVCHTDNVQQLIELYSSADVLFNSSTEVTFGLVTAEAMSCGTPAIVFRNTAGEEIINEETGYVVDSINEIPTIVSKCREESEKKRTKCRERIAAKFDSVKQYSKYIDLYRSMTHQ